MTRKIYDYDKGTEKLVNQVKNMVLPPDFVAQYDMVEMVHRFRDGFKNLEIRKKVLKQDYEQERLQHKRFSAGFCGVASYTWSHLFRMPDKTEVWNLKAVTSQKYKFLNHVWLENNISKEIFDLTFDQFIDLNGNYIEFPYYVSGQHANCDFVFERAYEFAEGLGIKNMQKIVFENIFSSLDRR